MDSNLDRISRGLASTTSRRQAFKMLGGSLLGGALAGAGFAVAKDTAAQGGPQGGPGSLETPVAGTLADGSAFEGVFEITRFTNQGGALTAAGNLFDAVGEFLGAIAAPVTSVDATCEVLSLTLGPLHLDLLGLVIDLNQVELDITAEQGPGNLLGNLLCAVTGLLDNGGPLQAITGLLNQILGALG